MFLFYCLLWRFCLSTWVCPSMGMCGSSSPLPSIRCLTFTSPPPPSSRDEREGFLKPQFFWGKMGLIFQMPTHTDPNQGKIRRGHQHLGHLGLLALFAFFLFNTFIRVHGHKGQPKKSHAGKRERGVVKGRRLFSLLVFFFLFSLLSDIF